MTNSLLSILVVSTNDDTRAALVETLGNHGVIPVPCASFREAETLALRNVFNGLLTDLPSIIKAKGEEKMVAYTLEHFFPTLRVRAFGTTIVPMAMPGSAAQDKSLGDFLTKTCPYFPARSLREHKRHPVILLTLVRYSGEEIRGFTLNLSWGGAFIAEVQAERFTVGDRIEICFLDLDCTVNAEIRWTMPWGKGGAPGIGIRFLELDAAFETMFVDLLKTRREFDRDRLTP